MPPICDHSGFGSHLTSGHRGPGSQVELLLRADPLPSAYGERLAAEAHYPGQRAREGLVQGTQRSCYVESPVSFTLLLFLSALSLRQALSDTGALIFHAALLQTHRLDWGYDE